MYKAMSFPHIITWLRGSGRHADAHHLVLQPRSRGIVGHYFRNAAGYHFPLCRTPGNVCFGIYVHQPQSPCRLLQVVLLPQNVPVGAFAVFAVFVAVPWRCLVFTATPASRSSRQLILSSPAAAPYIWHFSVRYLVFYAIYPLLLRYF